MIRTRVLWPILIIRNPKIALVIIKAPIVARITYDPDSPTSRADDPAYNLLSALPCN